jgi:hypothetical protein
MRMSKSEIGLAVAWLLAAALMLSIVISAQAQDPPLEPRILAYDKGPAKIDVSKYPKEMRDRYKVFTDKCGKCHTLARPINCDFVLEDEWERYVKRMMNKSGTFISADQGKLIYEFLVYDSKTRKKALYDKRSKGGE